MTPRPPSDLTRTETGVLNIHTGLPMPRNLIFLPAVLVVISVLQQGVAWKGGLPVANGGAGKTVFALVEMGLLLLLLWNGWRIRRWVHSIQVATNRSPTLTKVATLVFASLTLCVIGDTVNRNFAQVYYAHDTVIEHSYLVDSVWFFLPGYALFVLAAWRATAGRVPTLLRWPALVIAAVAGGASFADMVLPGISPYVMLMTGSYTVVIALMVPVALWIAVALGVHAWPVAVGAVLATVADALIGQFWLFGHGNYPDIAYLNFVVYFLSQALLQQLPLRAMLLPDIKHGA